jgi:hypothetical protein
LRPNQLPSATGRNLRHRLSCAKEFSPLDGRGGLLGDNEEPSTSVGFSSLLPLLSELLLSKSRHSSRGRKHEAFRVVALAKHKGRVGTCNREGNASMASFGMKVKKHKIGKKADLSKALSKMLPFIVAGTAIAALTQPASFTW